jgi:hypothetical protein
MVAKSTSFVSNASSPRSRFPKSIGQPCLRSCGARRSQHDGILGLRTAADCLGSAFGSGRPAPLPVYSTEERLPRCCLAHRNDGHEVRHRGHRSKRMSRWLSQPCHWTIYQASSSTLYVVFPILVNAMQ